ncbi:MAG: aldehyde ferredoxin oxidoreductase family protein [Candidatus Atabeyarchaeum deiterrae]
MKALRLDLGTKEFASEVIKEDWEKTLIGGKGLGARFLLNEVNSEVEPLSPMNKLVFAVGPATGTRFPTANRYGVFFKSPLTNIFGESYSGGHVAHRMRGTGHEIFIIQGKASNPTYLVITEGHVEFRNADHLWRQDTFATHDIIRKDEGQKNLGILCIGPAGENHVRFAVIENDYWRSAGRTGAGAVMGSKNLKAVAFQGDKEPEVHDEGLFKEVVNESLKLIRENRSTGVTYKEYGTLAVLDLVNEAGVLPVRYWSEGTTTHIENINSTAMKDKVLIGSRACWNCPIACGKLCEAKEGKYKGIKVEGPEYETVYAFGGLCDIGEIESIMAINDYCDRAGIDTITSGNVAAMAIEAERTGKLKTGLNMEYGDAEKVIKLLKMITKREGAGDILAEGVKRASRKLRLPEVDITVKGLELPGYDPRGVIGMGLGYAVSSRGACHLRSTVQVPELRGVIDRFAYDGKAQYVVDLENRYAIFDSLIICRFIRDIVPWDRMPSLLKALTGESLAEERLKEIGNNIITLTRLFNVREGITTADDTLPKRFFNQPLPEGASKGKTVDEHRFEQMVKEYYQLRGWNSNGVPEPTQDQNVKNEPESEK